MVKYRVYKQKGRYYIDKKILFLWVGVSEYVEMNIGYQYHGYNRLVSFDELQYANNYVEWLTKTIIREH